MRSMQQILTDAKQTARRSALLTTQLKNQALRLMAKGLKENIPLILQANQQDLENAKGRLSSVMMDRLRLDEKRILAMAQGILDVVQLPDPVNEVLEETVRPNGIRITKKRVPLGVVGVIYESRPNVTSDVGALCFKSGNVCILRGGKDGYQTSLCIVEILRNALKEAGVDENFINIPFDTSRESANLLMTAVGYVDALIPRGGAGLIRSCVENAKVPCIQTGTGICHVYVDEFADLNKALQIIENAKTSRPSVCNAEEVCLVHRKVAHSFLPMLKNTLVEKRLQKGLPKVELRVDKIASTIIDGTKATDEDFDTEFLDYILAVKVVDSLEEAIEHISVHSTGHSDCIVTENEQNADTFTAMIDSSAVYVNASTRFTDGGEFGMGCEIGISTQKLHARGPMGLKELTSYKYIVRGNGQIR